MKTVKLICTPLLLFLLNACSEPTANREILLHHEDVQQAYENLLKKEAEKKEQVDSIFFGVYLKMTANSFWDYCNKMFKAGIFKGSYDYQVAVQLDRPFKKPVMLKFYPSFEKPFISKMLCRFNYIGANVYNKADRANVLIQELISVMMEWYGGNKFIEMPSGNPLKGPRYIKIDANRKITVSQSDSETDVDVIYEDLKPLF